MSLALGSTENALDAKDAQYQQGLDSVLNTSRESLEDLTVVFATHVQDSLKDQLGSVLRKILSLTVGIAKEMSTWPARGIDDDNYVDFDRHLRPKVYGDATRFRNAGLTGCVVIHYTGQSWAYVESDDTISNPPEGEHHMYGFTTRGHGDNNVYFGLPEPQTGGDLAWDAPCCLTCNITAKVRDPTIKGACIGANADQTQTPIYSMALIPLWPTNTVRWAMLAHFGPLVGLGAATPWTHPGSAMRRASIVCGADMRSFDVMLRAAVRDASAPAMRLFVPQNANWLYDQLGPMLPMLKAAGMDVRPQDRLLAGVSHGESTYRYLDYGKAGACPARNVQPDGSCLLPWPREDTNATDPVIRAVARYVNGTYRSFPRDVHQIQLDVEGLGKGLYFVGVTLIQDSALLDWSFVVCIPRWSVLGRVDAFVDEVQERLRLSKEAVDRDLESDRDVLAMAVAGMLVGLVAVAIAYVYNITVQLSRLTVEMQRASEMQLDSLQGKDTSPLSRLSEVRSMQQSFRKMTANLREFRKYMPSNLLHEEIGDEDQGVCVLPPEGCVTLVFTDIQGSTSLWEQATEGMGIGLKIHNGVIRKALAEFGGYEVKTVGDAFFACFESPEDACRFGLKTQYDLSLQVWPQELSDCGLPQSARVEAAGQVLFSGLRIRIGIHRGSCELEMNPVTGRADYFGPPVNIAARLEANTVPGFVGVSGAVVAAVGKENLSSFCGAVVSLGTKELKGVGEAIDLTGLLPKGLEGRKNFVTADGRELAPQGKLPSTRNAPTVAVHRRGGQAAPVVPDRLRAWICGSRGAAASMFMPLPCSKTDTGLSSVLEVTNGHLSAAELAAERTEGLLQLCAGSQLLVTWNAGRRCHNPQEQVVEFVGLVYKGVKRLFERRDSRDLTRVVSAGVSSMEATPPPPAVRAARVGVAGGVLLPGNLFALHRRYATVLGGTIELAAALASYAQHWDTFALCSGVTGFRTRGHVRPLARWRVPDWPTEITVHELNAHSISELDPADEFLGSLSVRSPLTTWCPTSYREAWEQGAQHVLLQLADARPEDVVLRRIAATPQVSDPKDVWWICGLAVPESAVGANRRGSTCTSQALTSFGGSRSCGSPSGNAGGSSLWSPRPGNRSTAVSPDAVRSPEAVSGGSQ